VRLLLSEQGQQNLFFFPAEHFFRHVPFWCSSSGFPDRTSNMSSEKEEEKNFSTRY